MEKSDKNMLLALTGIYWARHFIQWLADADSISGVLIIMTPPPPPHKFTFIIAPSTYSWCAQ